MPCTVERGVTGKILLERSLISDMIQRCCGYSAPKSSRGGNLYSSRNKNIQPGTALVPREAVLGVGCKSSGRGSDPYLTCECGGFRYPQKMTVGR